MSIFNSSMFGPQPVYNPPAASQPLPPLSQDEQDSLLSTIGSGALHGLGWIGGSLSKALGGRAIRGALGMLSGHDVAPSELASFIPFSDTMGLTNAANEVRGSDLLGGNKDTPFLSPEGIGGLGIDLLTDPATYIGGVAGKALTPLGRSAAKIGISLPTGAARAAGLAGEVSEPVARAAQLGGQAVQGPLRGAIEGTSSFLNPEVQALAKATGKTYADVAGQSLGGHLNLHIPFTGIETSLNLAPFGNQIASVASKIPGATTAGGLLSSAAENVAMPFNAMFQKSAKGQVDPLFQAAAKEASAKALGGATEARSAITPILEQMQAVVGHTPGAEWTAAHDAASRNLGRDIVTAIERLPNANRPAEAAVLKTLSPESIDIAQKMATHYGNEHAMNVAKGIAGGELEGLGYAFRQNVLENSRSGVPWSQMSPEQQIARKKMFSSLPSPELNAGTPWQQAYNQAKASGMSPTEAIAAADKAAASEGKLLKEPWEMTREELAKKAQGGKIGPYERPDIEDIDLSFNTASEGKIDAVAKGAKPAAEIQGQDMIDRATNAGLKVKPSPQSPGMFVAYKNESDFQKLASAKNSAEMGRALGYSEADIAAWYANNNFELYNKARESMPRQAAIPGSVQEWMPTGSALEGEAGKPASYIGKNGKKYTIDVAPQELSDGSLGFRVFAENEAGEEVGRAVFDRRGSVRGGSLPGSNYTAAGLSVNPQHQQQGLANAMYDYFHRELGALPEGHELAGKILPSDSATASMVGETRGGGKSLWEQNAERVAATNAPKTLYTEGENSLNALSQMQFDPQAFPTLESKAAWIRSNMTMNPAELNEYARLSNKAQMALTPAEEARLTELLGKSRATPTAADQAELASLTQRRNTMIPKDPLATPEGLSSGERVYTAKPAANNAELESMKDFLRKEGFDDSDFAQMDAKELKANWRIRQPMEGAAPAQQAAAKLPVSHQNVEEVAADLMHENHGHEGLVPIEELRAKFDNPEAVDEAVMDMWRTHRDDPYQGINIVGNSHKEGSYYVEFKQRPEIKVKPVPPGTHEAIMNKFDELLAKEKSGLVPIWKVREAIAKELGPNVARHDVLDDAILELWRQGKVKLEGISDLSSAGGINRLNESIPGVGNILFYLEEVHPSPGQVESAARPAVNVGSLGAPGKTPGPALRRLTPSEESRMAELASGGMSARDSDELAILIAKRSRHMSPQEQTTYQLLKDKFKQASDLAEWQGGLDKPAMEAAGGFFGHHPLAMAEQYGLNQASRRISAESAWGLLNKIAVPAGEGGPEAMQLTEVLKQAGLDVRQSEAWLGKNPHGLVVPGEQARTLLGYLNPNRAAAPAAFKPVLSALDTMVNLTKAGQTSWPSTQVRNVLSDMYKRWSTGGSLAAPLMEAKTLREGGVIQGIANKIPRFAGMSDADATKQLLREVYQLGLSDTKKYQALEASGQGFDVLAKGQPVVGARPSGLGASLKATLPGSAAELNPLSMTSKTNPLAVRGAFGAEESKFIPTAASQSAQTYFEDLNRLATYIDASSRGYDPLAAMGKVIEAHHDFSNMSNFERDVMRRVVPFYSWSRQNMPNVLGEIATNPGGRMAQTMRALNSMQGGQTGFVPGDLSKTGYAIPAGTTDDNRQRYLASLGLPFEDIAQLTSLSQLMAQTTPFMRVPYELATGRQIFQGRDLPATYPLQLPFQGQIGNELLSAGPLGRLLSVGSNVGRAVENPQRALPTAINLGLGPRTVEVNQETARRRAIMDFAENALRSNPNVRQFQNVYVPREKISSLSPEEMRILRLYQMALHPQPSH